MRAEDEPQVRHPEAGGPDLGGGGGGQPGHPGKTNQIFLSPDQLSLLAPTEQPVAAAIFICFHTKGESWSGPALNIFRDLFWPVRQTGACGGSVCGRGDRGHPRVFPIRDFQLVALPDSKWRLVCVKELSSQALLCTLGSREGVKKKANRTLNASSFSRQRAKNTTGIKFAHDTD